MWSRCEYLPIVDWLWCSHEGTSPASSECTGQYCQQCSIKRRYRSLKSCCFSDSSHHSAILRVSARVRYGVIPACHTTAAPCQKDQSSMEAMCWAVCRDLGAHIDGFVATAAHTLVVTADEESAVTGKAADVISAANTALEAAIRLIRPGKKISEVSSIPFHKTPLFEVRSEVSLLIHTAVSASSYQNIYQEEILNYDPHLSRLYLWPRLDVRC